MATQTRPLVAPVEAKRRPRRWSWTHLFAVVAIPWAIWQGWTLIAWLADGPYYMTDNQTPHSLNWWMCKSIEGLTLAISLVMIGFLVWEFRNRRRRFWFDIAFMFATFMTFWNDYGLNLFNPIFTISANFVNVNSPLGHAPFFPNPDAGRGPDAIWIWASDAFGYLGMAILCGYLVRYCRRRYPGISDLKLVGVLCLLGIPFDLAVESFATAFGLWHYATPFSFGVGQGRLLVIEPIAAGIFFGLIAACRAIEDDQGRTFLERGLERHSPKVAGAITVAALYAVMECITWGPGTPWVYFPFASWDHVKVEPYLVNDMCDAPGVTGTRYGPCPGSDGYRMPGRASHLPGESP
jgi:hypothetical protein